MSYPPDVTVLTLKPDNPCNTTIADADGIELYHVKTVVGEQTRTFVRDAHDEIIAVSEWHGIRTDRITWGKNAPISMSDWMKKSLIPFKDDLSFKDQQGRHYKWKGNSPGSSLELFSEDDKFAQPIARFLKARRLPKTDPPYWTTPMLVLAARAAEIRDLVVVSFLFIEKSHRMGETDSDKVIQTWGLPISGATATTGGITALNGAF